MSNVWPRVSRSPGARSGLPAKVRRKIVVAVGEAYREAMRGFAEQSLMDVWYAHLDVEDAVRDFTSDIKAKRVKTMESMLSKAYTHDSTQALSKLTTVVDGEAAHRQRAADDRARRGRVQRI